MSHSLASVKSRIVYLSGAGLPRLSWKKAIKHMYVCHLTLLSRLICWFGSLSWNYSKGQILFWDNKVYTYEDGLFDCGVQLLKITLCCKNCTIFNTPCYTIIQDKMKWFSPKCLFRYLRNHTSELHPIFYECCLWLWLCPALAALQ